MLSFEFVPMGSSLIAHVLTWLKPAFLKSTVFSIENGSARIVRSAVTVLVVLPCWNVSFEVPSALRAIATSGEL
jgi:hypothetical protein